MTRLKQVFWDYLHRSGDFCGRSKRSSYWLVVLANLVITALAGPIFLASGALRSLNSLTNAMGSGLVILMAIVLVVLIYQGLPFLTLSLRRYRDAGVPGWLAAVSLLVQLVLLSIAAYQHNRVLLVIGCALWLIDAVIKALPSRPAKAAKGFQPALEQPGKPGTKLGPAFKNLMLRAGVFSGGSSRSQFWWPALIYWLVMMGTFLLLVWLMLFAVLTDPKDSFSGILLAAVLIVLVGTSLVALPSLTLSLRRYRDAGVSPWWYIALTAAMMIVELMDTNSDNLNLSLLTLVLAAVQVVILALPTHRGRQE